MSSETASSIGSRPGSSVRWCAERVESPGGREILKVARVATGLDSAGEEAANVGGQAARLLPE
jgi:hypothetical protein